MNSKPTTQKATPDLVILPQAHTTIPADHLTPQEQTAVTQAWKNYTPHQHPRTDGWTAHIIHIINGQPTTTAIITLPKQPTRPAPDPATHADNDASKQASNAPQFA